MKDNLKASNDYGSVVQSELLVTLYDITLAPGVLLELTDFFKQFLDTLPKTYESEEDKAAYLQFILYYGTHYVSAATFGGSGVMSSAVNKEYQSSSSSQAVAAQASAHFAWLKAGRNSSSETDQSEESFRAGGSFTTSVVGGDPTNLTDWGEWEKTFYQAPAMIGYTLHSISELVLGVDSALADNVSKAVEEYAGGAAELCKLESDQIKELNDQISDLDASQDSMCGCANLGKVCGYLGSIYECYGCLTEKPGANEVPSFHTFWMYDDKSCFASSYSTTAESKACCEASTKCCN